MSKKYVPRDHSDKAVLAEMFAKEHSPLLDPITVRYDDQWNCFVVSGYTNKEKDGQFSTQMRPYKVYVWVSDYGTCTFTSPGKKPWGENPNDI